MLYKILNPQTCVVEGSNSERDGDQETHDYRSRITHLQLKCDYHLKIVIIIFGTG